MLSSLPTEIVMDAEDRWPVRQCPLDSFGYIDFGKREILIREDQPEAQKHIALFHELIHAADQIARDSGVYVPELSEEQVVGLTGALWPLLASSGLWPGATEADVEELASCRADGSDFDIANLVE